MKFFLNHLQTLGVELLGRPEALVEEPHDGGVELPVHPPEQSQLMEGEVTEHQVHDRLWQRLQGKGGGHDLTN